MSVTLRHSNKHRLNSDNYKLRIDLNLSLAKLDLSYYAKIPRMSRWVNKVNKVWNNSLFKYPELPEFSLAEENLPFQVGKKISAKEYNTFLDRNESSGYKFCWDNKKVYVVEWQAQSMKMHEKYVRCVFGVKIYPKTFIGTTTHQAIIARLWVRQVLPGSVLSSNTTLEEERQHLILSQQELDFLLFQMDALKKIGNKVDKTVQNYPKLPKFLLGEENLPFQIGKNGSVKDYNTFLDRNESSGYKFRWENENVYIVDMANQKHGAVVSVLFKWFDRPNNGVIHGHYDPTVNGKKIAVRGSSAHVLLPPTRYPGPPPSDAKGNPHARIICEVANPRNIVDWNQKCEAWMHEDYVRCVLGIKLDHPGVESPGFSFVLSPPTPEAALSNESLKHSQQ
ncbi:11187_t:CDS:2 [Paraglomus brasilianum]|uniref:11187_t:CDS:1 n=1 Tax=Paraglomus brasilianum TaxID=144538 RepID=A0A9N9BVP3_9GLOM|nr:11187_t:CDS:2 [Paraglomus brasilianum]